MYLTTDASLNRELTRSPIDIQTIITMYNRNRRVADNPLASWLNWAIDDAANGVIRFFRLHVVSYMVLSSQTGNDQLPINSNLTDGYPPNVDGKFHIIEGD